MRSARTGQWQVAPRSTVTSATTWWSEGRLHQGGDDLGSAVVEELRAADATYEAGAEHLAPCAGSWVLVLEDGGARHARLSTVPAGAVVAYQGRLLEVGAGGVRATGEVLGRVVETFSRTAEGLYEVEAELPDGELVWLNATAEHPFYSVDAGKYVSVRELGVGSRLHVEGGGEALLVSKTWRQGRVEVFNFEVEGEHNYFVGGVLTHNATGCYVIEFSNGCIYVGKGGKRRMRKSARDKQRDNKTTAINQTWRESKNNADAFRDEAYWMDLLGWGDPSRSVCFYNKINSPGHGKYNIWR